MCDIFPVLPRELQVTVLKYCVAPQRVVVLGDSRVKLCTLVQKPGTPVKPILSHHQLYTCDTPSYVSATMLDCDVHAGVPACAVAAATLFWVVLDVTPDTPIVRSLLYYWLEARVSPFLRTWHLVLNMPDADLLTDMQHLEIKTLKPHSVWALNLDGHDRDEIHNFIKSTIKFV